ncbi:MAG: hypothetical protein K5894_05005 [Lachnospiraceae bacterium]|nr:hypothetical protein [Lachnospiraceae bacterium]
MENDLSKAECRGAFIIKKIFYLILLLAMIYTDIMLLAVLKLSMEDGAFYFWATLLFFICLTLAIIFNFKRIIREINANNQSFPVYNTVFSTDEIRELLKNEDFHPMIFPPDFKHLEYFKESRNFFLIKNRFIPKNALVQIFISRHRASSSATEYKRIHMTYFGGEVFEFELSPSMSDGARRYINDLFDDKYKIRPRTFKEICSDKKIFTDKCRKIADELFLKSGERDRKTFLLNVIKGKYNVRSRFYLE